MRQGTGGGVDLNLFCSWEMAMMGDRRSMEGGASAMVARAMPQPTGLGTRLPRDLRKESVDMSSKDNFREVMGGMEVEDMARAERGRERARVRMVTGMEG